MVVIETDDGEPDEVIDGQQRLTSLTTIAAICFDKISSIKNPSGEVMAWTTTLSGMLAKAQGGSFKPKLSFSDQDINNFFFESTFKKKNKTEKEAYWAEQWCKDRLSRRRSPFFKMKEALTVGYEELADFLKEVKEEDKKLKRLISFTKLLTEGVILLRIKAMSYSNAYAIFESLNNRGIPLSQSDLIKNEILKSCAASDLDDVAEHWQASRQIIESIEIISMPDFVHYSYISRFGMVKANKLYEKVKEKTSTSAKAKEYAENLENDAKALEFLTESFSASWKQETSYMLKDIKNVLNIRHCYPFLISAYHSVGNKNNEFNAYVELVMNFAFRYMKVIEDPLENFSAAIGSACQMIAAGKDIEEIRTHFQTCAPDEIFIKKFEEASFSNTKLAYFTVYYLEKIQLGGTNPKDHGVDQNLEHIMPKTPTANNWVDAFNTKKDNPILFKEYLWKIGNLLPLTAEINKSLKNKPINLKIKDPSGLDYTSNNHNLKSPTLIPQFLDNSQWTFESIDRRQKYLAENLAVKAWPL